MRLNRSLLKVLISGIILVAAITAAYGSQPVFKEETTKAASPVLNREANLSSETPEVESKAVSLAIDELYKEKEIINEKIESKPKVLTMKNDETKKVSVAKNYSKKVAEKTQVKKVVTKTSTARKVYSAGKTQTASKPSLTREQKIAMEQKRAEQILASYIAKYPILKGVKIYVRDCPNNWQGCAYYTKGIILVDPDHTASLEAIIAHEVKHIIDWREDHKIDYNDYHK